MKHVGTLQITTPSERSREVRDAVLKTPMESGVAESYDTLDDLLASTLA